MDSNLLSTTNLSKEIGIEASELFSILSSNRWIERKSDKWLLTKIGEDKGGKIIKSEKFGEYIGWPSSLKDEITKLLKVYHNTLLTASVIAEKYKTSAQKINLILSEIGWIEQDIAGWKITKLGKVIGGVEKEYAEKGTIYVTWPETILTNKMFTESLVQNNLIKQEIEKISAESFRTKYEATFRAQDGHMVRSRAELLIDNYLYQYGIIHAYEKQIALDDGEMYCDFYIPTKKIYIEYWGLEDNPEYVERKNIKLKKYESEELNLIEIHDKEINNLDDILPKKLIKFGIKIN